MKWTLLCTGLFLIISGACIWRFQLVRLLNNVNAARVIDKQKATRNAGIYLMLLGAAFVMFGFKVEALTDQQIILTIACFIPANMVVVVSYLVAQSRNMK
jgi:hypothetical protein